MHRPSRALLRRSARLPAILLVLVAPLAVSLAGGCVSDSSDPTVELVGESTGDAGAISYGRLLQDLDSRVDRFVHLKSQAGVESMRERELLSSALEAVVAQNETQLIGSLTGEELSRRRIAAKALAFSATDGAVAALATALDTSDDPRLLTNVAFALARRQSASTPPASLIRWLDSQDDDIRNNVLIAMWHVIDSRTAAGSAPLDPADLTRAMPLIEAALFDPDDPYVRGHAAATLGALGDQRSVDALINLLRDDHPFVRTHTALALGKLGDVKAVPALVTIIDETPRGTPRSAVVTGLAVLMESTGATVPEYLGESEAAWHDWVREELKAR